MHSLHSADFIAVIGPTAVGKTALGAKLAYEYNGEIISADSRQVYRGMDIGTGKDLSDYLVNGTHIPYYLIDITEPNTEYNLFQFKEDFYKACNNIRSKGRLPFVVGGTGLYLSSVIQNYSLKKTEQNNEVLEELHSLSDDELRKMLLKYKPVQHNTTDMLDRSRMINAILVAKTDDQSMPSKPLNSFVIGINPGRAIVKKRITERLKFRLQHGMLEEVESLINQGISFERLNLLGLEYRYAALYLQGKLNYNDMFQKLNSAIHDFAKRQMTWFRKMEKEGVVIHWLESADFEQAKTLISDHLIKPFSNSQV